MEEPRPTRYLFVLLYFSLGLMSKPMIVTLPLVLLLLDVWPLGRLATAEHSGTRATGKSIRQPFSASPSNQ